MKVFNNIFTPNANKEVLDLGSPEVSVSDGLTLMSVSFSISDDMEKEWKEGKKNFTFSFNYNSLLFNVETELFWSDSVYLGKIKIGNDELPFPAYVYQDAPNIIVCDFLIS